MRRGESDVWSADSWVCGMRGGTATPTARKTAAVVAPRSLRRRTPFPWLSPSVDASASKSRSASAHSNFSPCASRRASSSLRKTNARKLQNTWPRIVSSHLWKMARVSKSVLAARNISSPIHNCLYCRTVSSAVSSSRSVCKTHFPSNRSSHCTLASSIANLGPSLERYLRYPWLPTSALSPCLSCSRNDSTIAARSLRDLQLVPQPPEDQGRTDAVVADGGHVATAVGGEDHHGFREFRSRLQEAVALPTLLA